MRTNRGLTILYHIYHTLYHIVQYEIFRAKVCDFGKGGKSLFQCLFLSFDIYFLYKLSRASGRKRRKVMS